MRIKHTLSKIEPFNKTANCAIDGQVKIRKNATTWRCSVNINSYMRIWKQNKRNLKKDMLGSACEICGTTSGKLCWDHKHDPAYSLKRWDATKFDPKEFRGTLCNKCNMVLGLFKDNIQLFENAKKYLSKVS